MDPPLRFPIGGGKICRLKKALYRLKQSPRTRFGRLNRYMREYGFKQAHTDRTIFYEMNGGDIILLSVYVDDMIVIGNNIDKIKTLRNYLVKKFEMKDLGDLK